MINEKDLKEFKLRRIILPLLLYYIVGIVTQVIYCVYNLQDVVYGFMVDNQEIFGNVDEIMEGIAEVGLLSVFYEKLTDEVYIEFLYAFLEKMLQAVGLLTVLTAALSIPLLFIMIYKDSRSTNKVVEGKGRYSVHTYIWVCLGGISLCIGLNSLITLSGLMETDTSYEATAQALYNMQFWLRLVGLGMIVPIAEELLYRGIIFERLKESFDARIAIGISALIFATVHGNLVQFIYALICGVIFAWLYKEYGTIKAPIFAHATMNIASVLLSESGVFNIILSEQMHTSIIAVVSCTLTAVFYVLISNQSIVKEK